MSQASDRRRFTRIAFQSGATLFLPDGERPVDVLDLSLNGALIRPGAPGYIGVGSVCTLRIRLDNAGTTIRMEAVVVHHGAGERYGLACRDIDLDSITNLRRLVALNLGDDTLADREFQLLMGS